MNLKTLISSAIVMSVMTSGVAFAASTSNASPASTIVKPLKTTGSGEAVKSAESAAATTTPPTHKPPTPLPATKEAISKACSVQADTKNLHGKEREKFRSDCKKNGGKAS